jgi:hypothetical protein
VNLNGLMHADCLKDCYPLLSHSLVVAAAAAVVVAVVAAAASWVASAWLRRLRYINREHSNENSSLLEYMADDSERGPT